VKRIKRAGGVAQVVKYLASKQEILSSNSGTEREWERETGGERERERERE
jgi:hypothetical protein